MILGWKSCKEQLIVIVSVPDNAVMGHTAGRDQGLSQEFWTDILSDE